MTTWQSGIESHLIDDIIVGRKTIESRLMRGKFAEFKVDDVISLRRDYRDANGVLHDGDEYGVTVRIVSIRHYPDFQTLVQNENFKKVMPNVHTIQQAVAAYSQFYSTEDQTRYGVLAIEINIVTV
jgi:ASC-1-like (ASCH) protein